MEKEFVPYEIALKLKELGFDEPCFATYNSDKKVNRNPSHNMEDLPIEGQPYYWNNSKIYKSCITTPLYQQAFRWFREKYNIEHNNRPVKKFETDKSREISFYIDGYFISNLRFTTDKTYEEAELECLKKLIEIVKDGKK